MIIKKLKKKYKVGSRRGLASFKQTNLLRDLNLVIEWDLCELEEGESKCLVPGDTFILTEYKDFSQVIAVDSKEELILLISSSGPLALKRIYEEKMSPEFEMIFYCLEDDLDISWEASGTVPKGMKSFTPSYPLYKLWKTRFLTGRGFNDDFAIKITYISDTFFREPKSLYMRKWSILFPQEIPVELHEAMSKEILAWFYFHEDRISQVVEEVEEEKED